MSHSKVRPSWISQQCFSIPTNGGLCRIQVLCEHFAEPSYDEEQGVVGNTLDISHPFGAPALS